MRQTISEILEQVSQTQTENEKINLLRKNYSPALEDVLRWAYDSGIVFFTNTIPPYTPDESPDGLSLTTLYSEHKRFYMFLKEYRIDANRKNILLIQMLEGLGHNESKILEQVITKNIKSVSRDLLEKAYPGIFNRPIRIPMEA